jgi:hypothetical protein
MTEDNTAPAKPCDICGRPLPRGEGIIIGPTGQRVCRADVNTALAPYLPAKPQ